MIRSSVDNQDASQKQGHVDDSEDQNLIFTGDQLKATSEQEQRIASIAKLLDQGVAGAEDMQLDLQARPFVPSNMPSTSLPAEAKDHPQVSPRAELLVDNGDKQEEPPSLDVQILMMKTQHQFIQNLQRANLALKSKIKQLAEIQAQDDPTATLLSSNLQGENSGISPMQQQQQQQRPSQPKLSTTQQQTQATTTEADLEMLDETEAQPAMLEMVPIGKIEEVAKQKMIRQRSQNRYNSFAAGHYSRYQGRPALSQYYYDERVPYQMQQAQQPMQMHKSFHKAPKQYFDDSYYYEADYYRGYEEDYSRQNEQRHYERHSDNKPRNKHKISNWGAAKMQPNRSYHHGGAPKNQSRQAIHKPIYKAKKQVDAGKPRPLSSTQKTTENPRQFFKNVSQKTHDFENQRVKPRASEEEQKVVEVPQQVPVRQEIEEEEKVAMPSSQESEIKVQRVLEDFGFK